MRPLAWPIALVCGLSLVACGIVEFAPEPVEFAPQACPAALLEGTLVSGEGAMAVRQPDTDITYPVNWPDGWSVRDADGALELLDGSGRVVGREGDRFSAGGGFSSGSNEVFQPCGKIEITPAA